MIMISMNQISVNKELSNLGKEIIEILNEIELDFSQMSPTIQHNLIRIFYQFIDRYFKIQNMSPSKSLETEIEKFSSRIEKIEQSVLMRKSELKTSKNKKAQVLIKKSIDISESDKAYLDTISDILKKNSNYEKLIDLKWEQSNNSIPNYAYLY